MPHGWGILMAFPTLQTTSSGTASFGATSIGTSFPASTAAGDLLVLYVARQTAVTMNAVTGWNKIITDPTNGGTHECWWRRFQVGDTAPTVSATTGTGWAYRMIRITDASAVTAPAASALVTASSANPDPPSLTSGFGAVDTLWLAAVSSTSSSGPTAYPASYSGGLDINTGVGPDFAFASRQLNTATENPSTFTYGSIVTWLASVVAVPPVPFIAHQPYVYPPTFAVNRSYFY